MAVPIIDIKATLPPVAQPTTRSFQNMAGGRMRRRFTKSRRNIQAHSRHKRLYSGLKIVQQTSAQAVTMSIVIGEGHWFYADQDTPGIGEATASGGIRQRGVPWGEGTAFHEWVARVTPWPGTTERQMEFLLARKVSQDGTEGEYVVTEELEELLPDMERIAAQVAVDYTRRLLGQTVVEPAE